MFEAVLFRLVVGCSQSTSARLGKGCATTLRTRYNEWNRDGVFDRAVEEALAGYDRIIGLDPSDVSVDASLPGGPCGRDARCGVLGTVTLRAFAYGGRNPAPGI